MNKLNWLKKINKAKTVNKFDKVIQLCEDKKVLDVGCVGQDKSYQSELWLHARIKKVSRDLIGSDIDVEGAKVLNSKGFIVFTPDELNAQRDEMKFDVIVMGDVIEHVDNPVEFLNFYSQFLTENGTMLICTPNVLGARYSLQVLFFGNSGTNPEHTFGFEPYTILELFSRSKVEPVSFYWLKEYSKPQNYKQIYIRLHAAFLIFLRKYYHANFMFIVKSKK